MRHWGLFLAASFFWALGPVGSGGELNPDLTKDRTLVFGFINAGDAPSVPDWFQFAPAPQGKDGVSYDFRVEDGAFYREDLYPGHYQFLQFGVGDALGAGSWTVHWGDPQKDFAAPQSGKLYFLGSYRLRAKNDDPLDKGYYIEPTAFPNELEVLKKILPRLKGGPWKPLVEQRIMALSAAVTPTSPNELAPVNIPTPTPDIPTLP